MGEAGDQALEVYNSFKDKLKTYKVTGSDGAQTEVDKSQSYPEVLEQFADYAKKKKSLFQFNKRNQRPKEPFTDWLTDIKILIKVCDYDALEESLLKDRIIGGVVDKRLKETLKSKPNISLDEVIDICKAIDTTARHSSSDDVVLDQLNLHRPCTNYQQGTHAGFRGFRGRGRGRGVSQTGPVHQRLDIQAHQTSSAALDPNYTFLCKRCKREHKIASCPAFGSTCSNCGKKNHWSLACRSPPKHQLKKPPPKRKVHALEIADQGEYILEGFDEDKVIHQVETAEDDDVDPPPHKRARKEYSETLKIAEVNVLPYSIFLKLELHKLHPINRKNVLVKGFEDKISIINMGVTLPTETAHGSKKYCSRRAPFSVHFGGKAFCQWTELFPEMNYYSKLQIAVEK
ncbi:ATP-dependent RNA helicase [Frankliniella fusca]|uniref:ATP-dependent RNA helicase n=1 Tax=Frankliniella fusca TaxID=407009 RepID=A0AAE1I1J0_9NEOP|nr:ATP-dependent RNA helicase [Frankliniella fusca]